jgi:hypothetical protein
MLRSADEVDSLEEILEITLSPKFGTANERYEAMGKVLDHLGTRINPRYSKKIGEESVKRIFGFWRQADLRTPQERLPVLNHES